MASGSHHAAAARNGGNQGYRYAVQLQDRNDPLEEPEKDGRYFFDGHGPGAGTSTGGASQTQYHSHNINMLEPLEYAGTLPSRAVLSNNDTRRRSNKRRIIGMTSVAAALVAVVIVVVVVVKVVRGRHDDDSTASNDAWPAGWSEDMVFPTEFSGTGVNGIVAASQTPSAGTASSNYTRLISIGSSYSASASTREPQYASSLSPSGYYQGRWSNGPVWVEYLQGILANKTGSSVELLNYAYGGATTNNSIHASNVPDTGEQIRTYLASDDAKKSQQKALVTTFTSTNDITLEFMKLAASANATAEDPNGELLAPNLAVLERSAQSLLTQLASLIPSISEVGAVAPDFLILPIIPLGLSVRGNDLVRSEGIDEARFRQLVTRYNDVHQRIGISGRFSPETEARSTRMTSQPEETCCCSSLMNAIHANPTAYGIVDPTNGCFIESCTQPSKYVFWDNLHLTTTFQENLAKITAEIVSS